MKKKHFGMIDYRKTRALHTIMYFGNTAKGRKKLALSQHAILMVHGQIINFILIDFRLIPGQVID